MVSIDIDYGKVIDIFGKFYFIKDMHTVSIVHAVLENNTEIKIGDYVVYDNVHGEAKNVELCAYAHNRQKGRIK